MRDREHIAQALFDAIGWQTGLAEAWPKESAERQEALKMVEAYRRILKRRYGCDCTKLDKVLKGCRLMPVIPKPD